ncbi:MAG: NAD-glutamate dehydrogenase [Desulfuromonadaceae bacterium]|nr:NAD-glutamate dehydrogenase [Desulfuromonadaceae bacterium]
MSTPNIFIAHDNDRHSPEIDRITREVEAFPGTGFSDLQQALFHHLIAFTPAAYFQRLDPSLLAKIFSRIDRFFSAREQHVHVCIIPGACTTRYPLLMVNAVDAPYLLDSSQMLLNREGIPFRVVCHPILTVARAHGQVTRLSSQGGSGSQESLQLIELLCHDDLISRELTLRLEQVIEQTLDVARNRQSHYQLLKKLATQLPTKESRELLKWMCADNFVPLQYRSLLVTADNAEFIAEDTAAGRGPELWPAPELEAQDRMAMMTSFLHRDRHLVIEELELQSPVCRPEPLIYLGLRVADDAGVHEHIFCGFFTAQSFDDQIDSVPVLRRRIGAALNTLKLAVGSYDYRKSSDILNDFPKAELFQLSDEDLLTLIKSFVYLYRYRSVKIIVTRSLAVSGLSFLIMLPREFYSEQNRLKIEGFLRRTLKAEYMRSRMPRPTADYLSFQLHAYVPEVPQQLDIHRIEYALTHLTRPWPLKLQMLLQRHYGEDHGHLINSRYVGAFCTEYRQTIHPRFAVRDIVQLERVAADQQDRFDLWGPFLAAESYFRLQFYSVSEHDLNTLFPLLENLGISVIDEVDFEVSHPAQKLYIKSFKLREASSGGAIGPVRKRLLEILHALRAGAVENDYLNRLLLPTGLDWRAIDVFRGYRNYYFQLGNPFTKKRVAFSLIRNPQVAKLLFAYFAARFKDEPRWSDPAVREEEALMPLRLELLSALNAVADVNEDTILRALFNLIDSTVRTNYFNRIDSDDYFFAFKISAIGIIEMPAPRPLYEIYVHSASMEGIHLRGGRVARGGIRWSDRPDDFRTEILGLMKTQMTKNALIVPVGSKGGFVVKEEWSDRESGARLSSAAYQRLMRGLLDLTDNRVGKEIVRPAGIVAYDDTDPYLVVAADKGTAHLSDTANAISAAYGFWLDDAFASGGSHGYDHKELAITARGAWECVKTHFREIGINPEVAPISVVGIGDMSGDVFGNGMLLSKTVQLRAAFDHRHIFLDPNPDPASSWRERQRLFQLPRSSWEDYSAALISPGGGVYPRHAKDIPLSAEVRRWLNIRHESLDANSLISKLLSAEVDLLWNGGIGTYVKASDETNDMVGDRTNDNVRVNASELQAKVIGEGGNLGMTQRARVEYASHGGRINTDAIDNSAGVDCSDHEVNLKILMLQPTVHAQLADSAERNRVLADVTDIVCAMVLRNNYRQSLSLSLELKRCSAYPERHLALAERLDRGGVMDRKGESIPPAKVIMARDRRRFERPELAILMAYAKMHLFHTLIDSGVLDQPVYRPILDSYFPAPIQQRFANEFAHHPLCCEIIATVLTNNIIDQAGSSIIFDLMRETDASAFDVAERYLLFDAVINGDELRAAIYAGDYRMPAERQHEVLLRLEQLLYELCRRTLNNGEVLNFSTAEIERQSTLLAEYAKSLGGVIAADDWENYRAEAERLCTEGFSDEQARVLACLPLFVDFIDVAELATAVSCDFYTAANMVNEITRRFAITEIVPLIASRKADRWEQRAAELLTDDFRATLYQLSRQVITKNNGNLDAYCALRRRSERNYLRLLKDVRTAPAANLHPFTVLLAAFRSLVIE